jgi:septal ring factor EnvC (AmiA/AmiB activator)
MRHRAVPRLNIRLSILAAFTAALSIIPVSVRAQDATPDPAKLKSLERDLQQTQAERDRLQSQAAAASRALEAIRSDMIATAKDIQDQEYSLTVLENRIADMERDAKRLTDTLGRRDAQMIQVLLAVERLALRPSDALTLNPLSPEDAVRSAILLRSALPHIQQSTTALQKELAALYRMRAEITERKEQAAAGAATLLEKRRRLETLAQEKTSQHATLLVRGEDMTQRMAKIAREADDLRALFVKLAEEKARRDEEERKLAAKRAEERQARENERREKEQKLAAEKAVADAKIKNEAAAAPPAAGRIVLKPPPGVEPIPATNTERQTASLPPEPKTAPQADEEAVTRSFAKARGTMPFPVAGRLTSKYGEAANAAREAGLLAKGITITSRSGAQVVAPFDGIVAFAGPFRGYGQLLIIEHSEGYHTLLAGMGHIEGVVGQRVLAGEPLGVMENDGTPSLYVELRRNGQPINPLPWLASR